MNLLSSFIVTRIINALEQQFLSHLPELQQVFLNEVSNLVKMVSDWIESKMEKGESSNEEKRS